MAWSVQLQDTVCSFFKKGCWKIKKWRVKLHVTTPKGTEGSFRVTVQRPLDSIKIWENVAIGTRHCRFDKFLDLFDLLKCIDYWMPRFTFEILVCTDHEYVPFFDNLSWNNCILQALIAMQLMTNYCFASDFLLKSIIIKLSSAGFQNRNLCRF